MTLLLYVERPAAVVPVTSLPPCPRCEELFAAADRAGKRVGDGTGYDLSAALSRMTADALAQEGCPTCEGAGTVPPSALVGETVWLVRPGATVPPEIMGAFYAAELNPRWVGEATIAYTFDPHAGFEQKWAPHTPPFIRMAHDARRAAYASAPDGTSRYAVLLSGLVERDEETLPCPEGCQPGDFVDPIDMDLSGNLIYHSCDYRCVDGRVAPPDGAPGEMRRWA